MEAAKNTDSDFTKEDLVSKDAPHLQFNEWLRQAKECAEIPEPHSAALATCGSSGIPSVRMVHMEKIGPDGGVFYSNRFGKKGTEMEENANAAAVLYWQPLYRQVRIEGSVKKLSDESTKFFHSLPRDIQISTHVNEQIISGSVIDDMAVVKGEFERLQETYADKSIIIPKPPSWGGYVIEPVRFEFCKGHPNWLEDRIVFMRQNDSTWMVQQLAP